MPPFPAADRRTRTDLCPGALRPWPAEDGLLVRLRLVGGRLPVPALARLLAVSGAFADGEVHLTNRANLQIRGLPGQGGRLPSPVLSALESTGLLPSRSHELVRNVLVSPQTGHAGGRIDLRPLAARLDALLCAEPRFAALPGRFLFTLDDGRGDLLDRLTGAARRGTDLGLIALSATEAQLRIGPRWGAVIGLADAAEQLIELAGAFLTARGHGAAAPWHVHELGTPLRPDATVDPRIPARCGPLRYGAVPGGTHVPIPGGVVGGDLGRRLLDAAGHRTDVVVTPWHGVFVPAAQEETPWPAPPADHLSATATSTTARPST